MSELETRVLMLSRAQRLRLMERIAQSLRAEAEADTEMRNTAPNRYERLKRVMATCVGIPIEATREELAVWARAMIAYQMGAEGYTSVQIGRLMGKTHSTVLHLKTKVAEMLEFPRAFKEQFELWDTFQNKLNTNNNGNKQDTDAGAV